MPDLIDRHALLKNVYDNPPEKARMTQGEWCRKCIYEAPTIEPEVRHGRWIERQMDLICSVCKWEYSDELRFMSNHGLDSMAEAFAHCPHCGAKMDGGADNG